MVDVIVTKTIGKNYSVLMIEVGSGEYLCMYLYGQVKISEVRGPPCLPLPFLLLSNATLRLCNVTVSYTAFLLEFKGHLQTMER